MLATGARGDGGVATIGHCNVVVAGAVSGSLFGVSERGIPNFGARSIETRACATGGCWVEASKGDLVGERSFLFKFERWYVNSVDVARQW